MVWSNRQAGQIRRFAKATGTTTTLAANQDAPTSVVIGTTYVYWANSGTVAGGVARVPLAGGATEIVALDSGTARVATDATRVYWATADRILAAPLSGGTPVVLAIGQIVPAAIAVDEQAVYWLNFESGALSKVGK